MPERRIATVLMLDVVGSTHIAAQLGDVRYRELSSRFNRLVRAALKRFGGKEEDHAGDGFFATFSQPDRAIRCAAALAEEVRSLGIEIRSGIHTGQTEDQAGKTHGIAVVIGARVMSLADAGDILVTSTTKELVTGSGFGFEDFSAHELKGVPGTWQVFAVTGVNDEQRARPLPAAEAAERRAAIEPSARRVRPRRPALIAVGSGLLLLIISAVVFAATRGQQPEEPDRTESTGPPSGAVVQVDPERVPPILKSIPVPVPRVRVPGVTLPTSQHSMVVGQGGVWTVRFRDLFHVDPSRSEVRTRITLETRGPPFSANLAEGSDKIWFAYDNGLIEVNPATDEQRPVIPFSLRGYGSSDVVAGGGFVWFGTSSGRLVRFDPATARDRTRTGLDPIDAIAFGHGSVWTVDTVAGTVGRYDPETMRLVAEIDMPTAPAYLVSGDVAVWALSLSVGTLSQIDPATNDVRYQVPVGADPSGLAVGSGAVWVGDEDGIIRRVVEHTRQVIEIPFGAEVRALAYDEETDTLWVDVA
jgi:class 3 adenylate cyclase/streptogramin lyase